MSAVGAKGAGGRITEYVIEQGAFHVKKDASLIIDTSDVTKKYARKMKYLAEVRDGSETPLRPGKAQPRGDPNSCCPHNPDSWGDSWKAIFA